RFSRDWSSDVCSSDLNPRVSVLCRPLPSRSGVGMPRPPAFRFAPTRLVLLAVMMVTLHVCGDDEEPAPPPPRIVMVAEVEPGSPQAQTLRFAGVVESVTTTQLAFQVAGRVERVLVAEGARVTRGQALAKLDTTDYQLQLRDATARHRQLEADLARK